MATWNSSFESDPQDSDDRSEGALRIRETRQETSDRIETEHDAGPEHVSAGGNDDGRHLEGSARSFHQGSDPTALNDPAGTTLASDDSGRLLVRTDLQTVARVWSGSAWGNLHCAQLVDTEANILSISPASGDDGVLAWAHDERILYVARSGSWEIASHDARVSSDTDVTQVNSHYTGGTFTDSTLSAAVSIPAGGSSWKIVVRGFIVADETGAGINNFGIRLMENDGGGATAVSGAAQSAPTNGSVSIPFEYVKSIGVSASTTYTYTVEGGSSATFNKQMGTLPGGSFTQVGAITVKAIHDA